MSRAPFQLDTDILKKRLNSLATRTSRLSAEYDLLMERVELLEKQGRQNNELMEKETKVVLLLEFLMRDDVRANVINDYVIVFFRLVLLKMRQQGHDFDDVLQLSKALDEEEVAFVFRLILRDLDFPESELSSVLTLLEATKHRKWPSPDTSQVQTSSPAGDAQISSALIYLRAQDELDPQVNASLRRAICLAHESVLSDTAVCEVVPDTNLNDNAADMTVACERACGTSDDDSLLSTWDNHKLLRSCHTPTTRSRGKQCCRFDRNAILQSQNVFEMTSGIANSMDIFHGVRGNEDDGECSRKEEIEEDVDEETARDDNGPRLMIWRARRHGVVSCDVGTSTHDVMDSTFDELDRLSYSSARLTPLRLASRSLDAAVMAGDASNDEAYCCKQRCFSDMESAPDRAFFKASQMKEKEKEEEDEKEEEEEKPEAKECEVGNEDPSASEEEAEEEDATEEESSPIARYSELLDHRFSAAVEFSTWHYVFGFFDEADGDDNRYREAEDDREQPATTTAPSTHIPAEKTESCDCYLS